MNDRDVFDAWAPADVPWSAWAKPTLFVERSTAGGVAPPGAAAADARHQQPPMQSRELGWPEHLPPRSAIVLEMPGVLSIEAGLALRDKGYWPVPLFNATSGPNAYVDVGAIARGLREGASSLRGSRDPEVLPCFLLDAHRCPPGVGGAAGRYDNRSIVFPQDFPSATLLRSRGIEQVVVVSHGTGSPELAADLSHVLFGWQRDGLRIMRFEPAKQKQPQAVEVMKPSGFGMFWRRILTIAGLRRSGAGGFGSLIPEASSGSGYA